jgi:hypothetical protein
VQIAIALFADTARLVFTPARVLLRHESHPGREISSRSERSWIGNASDKSCGQRRTDAGDRVQARSLVAFERCYAMMRRSNSSIWTLSARN